MWRSLAGDGSVIAARDNGREAFDRSFNGQWDPLNLAYFNGYAMWTYHAAPFVFGEPGYVARDIAPIADEGATLRGVAVRFPEGVHSHTREQRFYFGADGLLRRHDYTVDVWADTPAAHFLSDYVDVEGLKYPTRRSVFGAQARRQHSIGISTPLRSSCRITRHFERGRCTCDDAIVLIRRVRLDGDDGSSLRLRRHMLRKGFSSRLSR